MYMANWDLYIWIWEAGINNVYIFHCLKMAMEKLPSLKGIHIFSIPILNQVRSLLVDVTKENVSSTMVFDFLQTFRSR